MLHSLAEFVPPAELAAEDTPDYWYEGRCPYTGQILRLPRTRLAKEIAQGLMAQLAQERTHQSEGKMYGVLLVRSQEGSFAVLKAFSGLLEGRGEVAGWVPPIQGREQVALQEAQTLTALDRIKQQLMALQDIPEREQFAVLAGDFDRQLRELAQTHQQRKAHRQDKRQAVQSQLEGESLTAVLEELDTESRWDGLERRRLKRERDTVLQPLKDAIASADSQILALKRQRQDLSRQLQAQMHETYRLINFAGKSQVLEALAQGTGLPTGTGDCCAPKLLQYAATHGLIPVAMSEFWWGRPSVNGDKQPGEFYGACEERCQPIMGFLLSGLPIAEEHPEYLSQSWVREGSEPFTKNLTPKEGHQSGFCLSQPSQKLLTRDTSKTQTAPALLILYEDQWLIAINKPAGLLSVPGRYLHTQDSVLSRLWYCLKEDKLLAVHRLDQDTSGILLMARDAETHRHLSHQFQQRQVQKIYEAVLEGVVKTSTGLIDLPLWSDPYDRPRQKVDWQRGKPSQTRYQVISIKTSPSPQTRIEFFPITGRTHQLRVHAATPEGLGVPIRGDRLYSSNPQSNFMHLHARELQFQHPHTKQSIRLTCETPF